MEVASPLPLDKNVYYTTTTEDDLNVDYPGPGATFKQKTGVNIQGLLEIVSKVFGYCNDSRPPTITSFGHGVFNRLFLVKLNGTEIIARLPFPKTRDDNRLRSDIATTIYIRQHTTIPAPMIFAWCTHHRNEAGVPYVLMERLPGKQMKGNIWDTMTWDQKKSFLPRVADIQAQLLKPLPFSRLGNLTLAGEAADEGIDSVAIRAASSTGKDVMQWTLGEFAVGPFISNPKEAASVNEYDVPEPSTGSYASLNEYWRAKVDIEFDAAYRRWGNPHADQVLEAEGGPHSWCDGDEDMTTANFAVAYQDLHSIISSYQTPPAELNTLCFSHQDFSFHNFLIDDEDSFNITGVIDWEDVCIVPVAAALRYPLTLLGPMPRDSGDLRWQLWVPNALPPVVGKPNVAYPTSSNWPEPMVQDSINQVWDRWYYRAKLAEVDPRFNSTAWQACKLTLQIHEIALGHWSHWLYALEWLAKTAQSLRGGDTRNIEAGSGDIDDEVDGEGD